VAYLDDDGGGGGGGGTDAIFVGIDALTAAAAPEVTELDAAAATTTPRGRIGRTGADDVLTFFLGGSSF
jgi:hypothetical protein